MTHGVSKIRTTGFAIAGAALLAVISSPAAAQAANTDATIVSAFATKLRDVIARIERDTTFIQLKDSPPISGYWQKAVCDVSDPKFDILRTASLVSPLMATVTLKAEVMVSQPRRERADADTARITEPQFSDWKPADLRLSYSFQDGAWVLTVGEYRITNTPRVAAVLGDDSGKAFSPLWTGKLGKSDKSFCADFDEWSSLR